MSDRYLHVVTFNVPHPPDYGGVIDVYYKLKALHAAGIRIHLHCYLYDRPRSAHLNSICETVTYYKRKMSIIDLLNQLPYIVYSRRSGKLLDNLLADENPILFEGIHTCYFLAHEKLSSRLKMVRAHNIESEYYRHLVEQASGLKKYYFKRESQKLAEFEKILKHANHIFTISSRDTIELSAVYDNVELLPPFHSSDKVTCMEGTGAYALYHGDLSISDNYQTGLYLCESIFTDMNIPLIIAGKKPNPKLIAKAKSHPNVQVIIDPDHEKMEELIRDAHVNIMLTSNTSGFKLKLINALFKGRYCLVNSNMLEGTGLDDLCLLGNSDESIRSLLNDYFNKPFESSEIQRRKNILEDKFSNASNAGKLIKILSHSSVSDMG
ncbi:MAG: glycosyltransferase family 1 protein [Bacteroidetes bacterium]|nr:glycosyltransferase family 1 protein [Bacteroidota bacterium]